MHIHMIEMIGVEIEIVERCKHMYAFAYLSYMYIVSYVRANRAYILEL